MVVAPPRGMKRTVLSLTAATALTMLSAPAAAQTISIDLGTEHQVIEGFGGFGPKNVWWNQGPWHDAAYLNLIVDDLGSTIVRTQLYWDGEEQNDNGDPNVFDWTGFDFGPDSDNGKQFAFLRDLHAKGGVKLIASVWTPPVWMKQNTDDGLAAFCHGQCGGNLNPALREEFAEYMAAYVIELKEETDVDLYALSLQNELIFANPFESCVYSADEYAELLKVVGARFATEGLATKFFGPEHMGDYDWNVNTQLFAEVLDDPDAAQYLHAYAVHGYLNGVDADFGNAQGWVSMDERVRDASKQLWMTETSNGGNEATWDGAWNMAIGLHLALRFGKINAWVYWYYADNIVSDNQPLPLFSFFKGWYKHVRPGFVQVESASSEQDVLVTAFKHGDSLTSVLINVGDSPHTVQLEVTGGAMPASFEVYRASEADDGYVGVGTVTDNTFDLPAKSFTTIVHVGEDPPPNTGGTGGGGSAGSGGSTSGGSAGSDPGTGGTGGLGGTGGAAGSPGGAGTAGAGGSPSANATDAEEAEGCACATSGSSGGQVAWVFAALAGIGILLRRRQ
jgi:MYXO-CTERM domain-containing protein